MNAFSKPLRRFTSHAEISSSDVRGLLPDHPALSEMRTIFPSTVIDAADSPRLLVSGINQRKLGNRVVKGNWRGMPIYALTLEERATCPASCARLADCYGNGMPYSRRHKSGADLEERLWGELEGKSSHHPAGFVVRLHILGDFYSTDYAALWLNALIWFPALRVFGYTAREPASDIGQVIMSMNALYPDRWVVRFSGDEIGPMRATTVSGEHKSAGPDVIMCPAQSGGTDCCGTCGLCWAPAAKGKTIAFALHGRKFSGRPRRVVAP